ncbi:unnamed protein product [Brassicogethes aeneus]|uniref:Sterol regulatory element-binding protein cleavage-activating protein n=1 Tax=Brassicogethes aeneus TaxID=1431903 RepID=A0A9P0B7E2_BRAAE|nr:unnamed protein product [Brassicogethes aeneus]
MTSHAEEPRNRGVIASFYYGLGLFCSTYPFSVIGFVGIIFILTCLPLYNLTLAISPQLVWTSPENASDLEQPFCYIQQVVIRVAVLPWEQELTLADAFRAPLYEAFKLLEVVRNYEDTTSSKTLGHLCVHIESTKKHVNDYSSILPQYSCLVLSPANLWNQDVQKFTSDNSLLTTIFNHHSFQKGKTSISEMLFGMHIVDTGIKRYPFRNRQRIIQYAITLFFKEYDSEFINGLKQKLVSLYPLHQNDVNAIEKVNLYNETLLIQYPGEINYLELIPLICALIVLFMYYYLTVRKIEIIKSKVGMAFTATITVFCSLTMTISICFFFGLTPALHGGKAIFPYLAIIVGLENNLVLTKSVVSTPNHLDVKIRKAQGLSIEGWAITKNILLEITIFTFGLFTFVPPIQEFCIFAIFALITDFFLQLFFFSTVLGIDISRSENCSDKANHNFRNTMYQNQMFLDKFKAKSINRSKSHPKLSTFPANIVAGQMQNSQEKKIPKRLILVNIWARTRFFQKSIMVLMVIWISMIAYNSDIINQFIVTNVLNDNQRDQNHSNLEPTYSTIKMYPILTSNESFDRVNYVTYNPLQTDYKQNQSQDLNKLKHLEYSPWLKLSTQHWPSIFKRYNMSLSGQVVAVLPNIKLSHVITPEQAKLMRNPEEKYGDKFQWQALAAALDPIDFNDVEKSANRLPQSEQPFYPTSPMEIALTMILCLISVLFLAYLFVLLYKCICSRNYAEWRASWYSERKEESSDEQVLLEAVPVVLEGHQQEIECIATDGMNLVSACLNGQLKVWDNNTGELMCHIDRKSYFCGDKLEDLSIDNDDLSDYESGSPPSRYDSFPRIKSRINTDFTLTKRGSLDAKSDFIRSYRHFYLKDDVPKVRNRPKNNEVYSEINRERLQKTYSSETNSEASLRNDSSCSNNSLMRALSDNSSKLSQIWCIDYLDNLIVIGCADGRLEFWEGTTGKLKCIFEDGTESGISHLKIVGSKIVAARLCGSLDLFHLQTYNQGRPVDWNFTCAYRRTHIRTGSMGSISDRDLNGQHHTDEDFRCLKLATIKSHQQPITCLDCEGGRILSGSQDHTLKVHRLDDGNPMYTLHGHCGPITCLFIDRVNPTTSGSGSQDGMLCVWDLLTGTCMYNIEAHNGSIMSLTYSASYVISLGSDERLCVWERFQGHLLNTINIPQAFSNHVLMLAPHLVMTARSGGLVVWDVRSGDCVRTIALGRSPYVFINQLIMLRDAVLCDFGTQLRIVRFPLITHKFE